MSRLPHAARRFVPCVVAALAVLTAGCSGSALDEKQYESLCTAMSIGGWTIARDRAVEQFGLDKPEAAEAVRTAVRDYCPQHSAKVG